jgi:hypothetical protein
VLSTIDIISLFSAFLSMLPVGVGLLGEQIIELVIPNTRRSRLYLQIFEISLGKPHDYHRPSHLSSHHILLILAII